MKKVGWIALDIDGTITFTKRDIPEKIKLFLRALSKDWQIIFLTGRTFNFAMSALADLNFPYYLGVENGAELIELPEKRKIYQKFLDSFALEQLEKIYQNIESDFLVCSGWEKGDFCYYRPDRFSDEQKKYLEELKNRQEENWHSLKEFDLSWIGAFPFIKCFGTQEMMENIFAKLKALDFCEISCIRDYYFPDLYLLLISHKQVSKGKTLQWIYEKKGNGPIICAGDDMNDLSMFDVADIKIAMQNAPEQLKEKADFIAPLAQDLGLIDGINFAINKLR